MEINGAAAGQWLVMLVVGLLLITAGIQGSAGRLLAVVFAPDHLQPWHVTASGSSSSSSSGSGTPPVPAPILSV